MHPASDYTQRRRSVSVTGSSSLRAQGRRPPWDVRTFAHIQPWPPQSYEHLASLLRSYSVAGAGTCFMCLYSSMQA